MRFGGRYLFLLLFLCLGLVVAYSQAIPSPGHGADEVSIMINGKARMSLQDAVTNGEFNGDFVGGGSYSGDVDFGHEEVYVRVDGVNKGLQQAIDDKSLCLSEGGSGSYSGAVSSRHKADNILINFDGEKSLQQAINEGLFGEDCLKLVNCAGYWNNYVGSCNAVACGTTDNYDRQWVTTVPSANGGIACPSPTFVANGGASCSAPACCVVSCSGKECGGDGCGGSCGSCDSSKSCSSLGKCIYSGTHSLSFSFGAYSNTGYYRMSDSGVSQCRTTVSSHGYKDTGWKTCSAKVSGGGGYYSTTSISGTTVTLALDAPRTTFNDKQRKTLNIVSGATSRTWWNT